jgi:CheY-like chemotaxis protein
VSVSPIAGTDALEFCRGNYLVTTESAGVARNDSPSDVLATPAQADLMFLDIRMPGKSGLDVMKELGKAPPFPVIAMTGNVDNESIDEYKCVDTVSQDLILISKNLLVSVLDAGRSALVAV